jgi:TolC family type I secretion outer membrane protein
MTALHFRVVRGAWILVTLCLIATASSAQTLQDSLIAAYRSNPQLQADRARQRATDEDVSRAWGGWRPQVTAAGQYGRAHDKFAFPSTLQGIYVNEDYRTLDTEQLQLSQAIWDGNRTLADVRHAKWAVANGRSLLTSTEQSVLGSVVQAYYDLYRDQQILAIQTEYVASLEREKKATTIRYAAKDVTQTDVAQSEARLARGIADLRQYEGDVEASKSSFVLAVGFEAGTLPPPPPLPASVPATEQEALDRVFDNPDLRATIFAAKAAEADVQAAESGIMPSLALIGTSSRASRTDYTLSTSLEKQIVLSLTIPLYDGGVSSARTREAKHTLGQRRYSVDYQHDKTVDQIKRTWDTLESSRARIDALRENVRAAQVALDGVQQELKVGSRTVIEELNARNEFYDAEIALLRSTHDQAVAAYSLLLACGRLTAADLGLPVDREDLDANYRATSWQPWGLWIGTDYPESPVTSDDDWP